MSAETPPTLSRRVAAIQAKLKAACLHENTTPGESQAALRGRAPELMSDLPRHYRHSVQLNISDGCHKDKKQFLLQFEKVCLFNLFTFLTASNGKHATFRVDLTP